MPCPNCNRPLEEHDGTSCESAHVREPSWSVSDNQAIGMDGNDFDIGTFVLQQTPGTANAQPTATEVQEDSVGPQLQVGVAPVNANVVPVAVLPVAPASPSAPISVNMILPTTTSNQAPNLDGQGMDLIRQRVSSLFQNVIRAVAFALDVRQYPLLAMTGLGQIWKFAKWIWHPFVKRGQEEPNGP